jgi:hypothetical protein
MGLADLRKRRGVPAKRGMRVTVNGAAGRITSAYGDNIRVRFDGMKRARNCHPTWRVIYFGDDGVTLLDTSDARAEIA